MEKSKCNLIIKFANENFSNNINSSDILKNYKKLLMYLEETKIVINFDDALFLIKNSEAINNMITQLTKNNIDYEFNSNLFLLVLACDINNKENKNNTDLSILNVYRSELSNRILSLEEEIELFKRKESGDKYAFDLIVYYNLKLVYSIAIEYTKKSHIELTDLIQEGNLGLIEAVNRFDYNRELKFCTYAVYWIRRNISLAISNKYEIIRHSTNTFEKIRKVKNYINQIVVLTGMEPTDEEIAKALDMPLEKIKDIKNYEYSYISFDTKIGEKKETDLYSIVADDNYSRDLNIDDIIRNEFHEDLEKIGLTDRELEIIKLKFGFYDDKTFTYEEIADIFNVSHQRIDQIMSNALKKLRNNNLIKSYCDEINDKVL